MSSEPGDPLKNIVFISIPESLDRTIGDLKIDPSILMPVELPHGEESWEITDLSWEMIVAGMLKVLAYQPDHADADYYRKFIREVKPSIVEELTATAILKARNKDFDLAEEIFKALGNLVPGDVGTFVNLALVYEEHSEAYDQIHNEKLRDEYAERAFQAYKRALRIAPESPDVNYNAAHFFLRQRNYVKAVEHLTLFLNKGTDPERIRRAERVVKELKSQDLLDNLFKEAFDFIRMGRERDGIAKIREFLALHPNVWNAWFLLGWGHRRLGEYQEGRKAFERAIELGGNQTDTYNELAICLMEIGELAESRRQLLTALKIEPENVKILSNLGIVSMRQENRDEAIGFFQTVLDLEPEDQIARNYLHFLDGEISEK